MRRFRAGTRDSGLGLFHPSYRLLIALLLPLVAAVNLVGCGGKSSSDEQGAGRAAVRLLNWKDFTDLDLLREFEEETGIEVELIEYETSQEMISRVQSRPDLCDLMVVDANLIPLLRELRVIEPLALEELPGLDDIKPGIRRFPLSDFQGVLGVPYLWGTTGLAVNKNLFKAEGVSWNDLWRKDLAGKVALLDDTREAMMAILMSCGFSANTRNPAELRAAEEKAVRLKENGVRLGETFENIRGVMEGELSLAEAYGGDVAVLAGEREDIAYVLPREGYNVWLDCFVLNSESLGRREAYALMRFFLRPEVSARSAMAFHYGTPFKRADAIVRESDGFRPSLFPEDGQLQEGEPFVELGMTNREYERIFQLLQ